MRKTLLAVALTLAMPVSASAAEICELVNDTANAWNALANLIHQTQGDGFSPDEVNEIAQAVGALTEGTATFAGVLQGAGNANQVALGKQLEDDLTRFASLSGAEDATFAASIIDNVTSSLDHITDDCDAAHGH